MCVFVCVYLCMYVCVCACVCVCAYIYVGVYIYLEKVLGNNNNDRMVFEDFALKCFKD